MSDRTVSVRLMLRTQEFMSGATSAAGSVRQLGGELDRLGRTSPSALNDVALAAGGAGLALSGIAGAAITMGAEFDKQMSEVAAVSDATASDLDRLRQAAVAAGKDTQYSATEAAKAEAELSKAGMGTADILRGGLSGALSLAAAGQMELADAAEITAKAMNMFNLPASAASHIADVFAATANKTAADMHELGLGLQQVGLVANQMGWSLEETSAMLGAFADRGLAGQDGATSLKTALMAMAAPTDKAATLMEKLGISVYDAGGEFLDARGIAAQLQDGLGGLDQASRNAAMATIFGSDAIRAANVLYGLGESGVTEYVSAVYDQGAAADVAAKKTDNLAGDIERLRGSVETLAIESGSGANGGLRILTQTLGSVVDAVSSLPGPVQTAGVVLAGVAGSALLAGAGIMKVRETTLDMMSALRDAGPVGARAADGLGKIGSVAGKIGVVGSVVAVLGIAMSALRDTLAKKTIHRDVDDLSTALERFAATGKVAGELGKTFGSDTSGLRRTIERIREAEKAAEAYNRKLKENPEWDAVDTKGMLKQQLSDIKALDAALATMVRNGNATQAKQALEDLVTTSGMSASQYQDLSSRLTEYSQASREATVASTGSASGFATQEQATRAMSRSWQSAIDTGQKLSDLFNELNGAAIGSARAEIAVENALRAAKTALDESNGSLDVHKEKGAAAKSAILDVADAMAKNLDAMRANGASLDEVSGKYGEYRDRLIEVMVRSGMTKDAARALAEQYLSMPEVVSTVVTSPGLAESAAALESYVKQLNALNGKRVKAYVTTEGNLHVGGGTSGGTMLLRYGGVAVPAATGALRDANVYPAGTSPLYAFAEPETGGEAFIPRYGQLGRSREIADYVVANWLGGSVSWGHGAGATSSHATGATVNIDTFVAGQATPDQIAEELGWKMRTRG